MEWTSMYVDRWTGPVEQALTSRYTSDAVVATVLVVNGRLCLGLSCCSSSGRGSQWWWKNVRGFKVYVRYMCISPED